MKKTEHVASFVYVLEADGSGLDYEDELRRQYCGDRHQIGIGKVVMLNQVIGRLESGGAQRLSVRSCCA